MLEKLLDDNDYVTVYFCNTNSLNFKAQSYFTFPNFRWRELCQMWGNFGRARTNWLRNGQFRYSLCSNKRSEICEEMGSDQGGLWKFYKISHDLNKFLEFQLPAIVYFRRKFPSIYRGALTDELVILEVNCYNAFVSLWFRLKCLSYRSSGFRRIVSSNPSWIFSCSPSLLSA